MTRFDLIASGLKSLAHNPDHPDAMFPPVPWSNLEFRMIADWDVDDSFVMMSRETYEKFLQDRGLFYGHGVHLVRSSGS
jgi:hypothetical protein